MAVRLPNSDTGLFQDPTSQNLFSGIDPSNFGTGPNSSFVDTSIFDSSKFDTGATAPTESVVSQGLSGANKAQLATGGIKAAGKVISSMIALNESNRLREDQKKTFNAQLGLERKAMMLNYMLGNRNYAEKLKLIRMAISQANARRSGIRGNQARLATARGSR